MSQPPAYSRSTDFSDDERQNAGGRATVRTAALDAEFDAAAISINALRDNLGLLQRDDGALRNSIVTPETLNPSVVMMFGGSKFVPRGVWLSGTAYAANDFIEQDGTTYVCRLAHTSNIFAADRAAGRWQLFPGQPGAGSTVFTPTTTVPATTVQEAIERVAADLRRDWVNVLDHLSDEQVMNAYLRLGTVDCGPGLQEAINESANRRLIWPSGYAFGCGQELIVRSPQRWEGGGIGKMLMPFQSTNGSITELRTLGSGAAYKTVKTRVRYRGAVTDPEDDPISALVNVQSQGVEIYGIVIRCTYDEGLITTDPTHLGDDWDCGIFVGCRLHFKTDANPVGCWRVAGLYCDVTRGPGLPELYGWDGIQHPVDTQYGGDGCRISDFITWGGKWGVLVKGANPKPGLVSYGVDYTVSLTATISTVPQSGDFIAFGGITFTFVDAPIYPTQVKIGVSEADCAANLVDACITYIETDAVAAAFRTAIYILDGNIVRTFRRDANSSDYAINFTASTVSGGRIVLSGSTPASIADPAPYCDQTLTAPTRPASVSDQRGNFGFSDFTIRDSQIFGSNHPTRYARQFITSSTITSPFTGTTVKDWLTDSGGGSFCIDGMAGNASRMLQGHRYINVRFDGKYDPFSAKLGRTNRDEFFGCHWDGASTTSFFKPDGSPASATNNPYDCKYGAVTRIPRITRRTRFYSRDTTPYREFFKLDDVGSGNTTDGSGRCEFTGNLTAYGGSLTSDGSAVSNGVGKVEAKGGSAGSSRYEFSNSLGTQGGIRYYYGSGNFWIALGGNINTALVARSDEANTATIRLYPTDVNGTAVYSSLGATRLESAVGETDIHGAAGVRLRYGNSTRLFLGSTDIEVFSSNFLPGATGTQNLGASAAAWANAYLNQLTLRPPASATPAANGDVVFQKTSDTQLQIKMKGSDGTVRTATLIFS